MKENNRKGQKYWDRKKEKRERERERERERRMKG